MKYNHEKILISFDNCVVGLVSVLTENMFGGNIKATKNSS